MGKGGIVGAIDLFPDFVHSYYVSTKQQEDLSSWVDLWDVLCYLDKMWMMTSCIWGWDFRAVVKYVVALDEWWERDRDLSVE